MCLSLAVGGSLAGEDVYIGTYTKSGVSKGIYRSSFDSETGRLGEPECVIEFQDPSFLAFSADGTRLYAVSESGGKVAAYRLSDSKQWEKINEQESGGKATCHVSVSPSGKFLAVANYTSGSVTSYRIAEDGSLSAPFVVQHEGSGPDVKRQKGPHVHSANFSADGRFLYVADLGTDRIYQYQPNEETGELKLLGETVVTPGAGPRHFTLHPKQDYAYLIHEMGLRVSAYQVDKKTGKLAEIQEIATLPEGVDPVGSTAEVLCHPSGKFLYGSNRGHDSIVVFRIDEATGKLSAAGHLKMRGEEPRGFVVSPDGKWLIVAAQNSDFVSVYAIDPDTGMPTFSGSEVKVGSPVCVRFAPVTH